MFLSKRAASCEYNRKVCALKEEKVAGIICDEGKLAILRRFSSVKICFLTRPIVIVYLRKS